MIKAISNIIDGRAVPAVSGAERDIVDPATGEVYLRSPQSGPEDVEQAVAAASRAFEIWRRATPGERQKGLLRLADLVEGHAEELIAIECANTGKPAAVMRTEEMPLSIDNLRFFAGAARSLEGKSAGEYKAGYTSYVRREPIGVVGQIAPWNYPLMMAIWKIAPAVAAGNTVVLKPAETTPASAVRLAELATTALGDGIVNVICGDRETGRALVEHREPAMFSITGSTRAGVQVAQTAARDLKRVHLELGGNAPVIVFDDVAIEQTAFKIAEGAYFNGGQDCTAATRVLVQKGLAEPFATALAAVARSTRVGGVDDETALFGPINNAAQFERVKGLVDRIPSHAQLLAGGRRIGTRGYYYEPTVVAGLGPKDEIVREEIFGPVITIQVFDDEADAVALANGVEYGLAASVWTRDHGRAMRVSNALDFGCVWVNAHGSFISEMPHGGFKQSGYGKDLSLYGFEDYTRIKHVMHELS